SREDRWREWKRVRGRAIAVVFDEADLRLRRRVTMPRPTYLRGAVSCYLDRCRGYLVNATPEEAVRQDALDWLIDEMSVPESLVRSEFNQKKRGAHGRADIIVLGPGASDYEGHALMVVECKRPGVFL